MPHASPRRSAADKYRQSSFNININTYSSCLDARWRQIQHTIMDYDDDEYFLPLEDQRVFGAGIKRKRVPFVPSSEAVLSTSKDTSGTSSIQSPQSEPSSIGDKYLSIVLSSSGARNSNPDSSLARSKSTPPSALPSESNSALTCEICRLPLSSAPPRSKDDGNTAQPHEASLAHQVCLPHSHPPSAIDRTRTGYKYLSTQGWDPDSRLGLGARGQGIQIPIKIKVKNDTLGLGIKPPKPNERPAKVKKEEKLNAKQVRKMEQESKHKGDKLREMFYSREDVEKYLGRSSAVLERPASKSSFKFKTMTPQRTRNISTISFISLVLLCLCVAVHIRPAACFDCGMGRGSVPGPPIVGMDIGTTQSSVGVIRHGKVDVLANDKDNRLIPSYIAWRDQELLVGEAAKEQYLLAPETGIFGLNHIIGRNYDELEQHILLRHPNLINSNNKPLLKIETANGTINFKPEEALTILIRHLKTIAESHLDNPVTEAVIAIPRNSRNTYRVALEHASQRASFQYAQFWNDDAATAVANGFNMVEDEELGIIIDIGGGSTKVTVLEHDNGVLDPLGFASDPSISGEEFDNRIIDFFINHNYNNLVMDIRNDQPAMAKLKHEAERAKIALSSTTDTRTASMKIPALAHPTTGTATEYFTTYLSRDEFDSITASLLTRLTTSLIPQALAAAQITNTSSIPHIFLTGGGAHIPQVQSLVTQFFERKFIPAVVAPEFSVVAGTAIGGGYRSESVPSWIVPMGPAPARMEEMVGERFRWRGERGGEDAYTTMGRRGPVDLIPFVSMNGTGEKREGAVKGSWWWSWW
ncbi:ATPase with role in protein import into the ER [Onygenales sp. PD_40]|nr:ATPase with role in protein import into the ER [Onygenales sp. PD_40]